MISIPINVEDLASANVTALNDALTNRQPLHEAIARSAHSITVDYMIQEVVPRHATAEKLGGNPTGHWEDPGSYISNAATGEKASVTIARTGIGRVAHDVTITPGPGKEFLTLPAIGAAYGKRAGEFPDKFLFPITNAGKGVLIHREPGQALGEVYYLLVPKVTQKRDRTLLPSDETFKQAALEGVASYLDYLLAGVGE